MMLSAVKVLAEEGGMHAGNAGQAAIRPRIGKAD